MNTGSIFKNGKFQNYMLTISRISSDIRTLVLRIAMYALTLIYQIALFKHLPSQEFLYWSITGLMTGLIGYIDLGFSNRFITRHLQFMKLNKRDWDFNSELNLLIKMAMESKRKFRIVFMYVSIACMIFNSLAIFIFVEFHPAIFLCSLLVLMLNAIMFYLVQFSALLDRNLTVLSCQLLGSLAQAILALFSHNLILNLLALGITPILGLLVWIKRIKAENDYFVQATFVEYVQDVTFNGKMQSIQLIGILTTLTTQFIPPMILPFNEIATSQIQLRISLSIIAIVTSLNMSALRLITLSPLKETLERIKLMFLFSFGLVSVFFVCSFFLWDSFLSEKMPPSPSSLFLFSLYVLSQPFAQGLYFFHLKNEHYHRLLFASLFQFLIQIFSLITSVQFLRSNAIPFSLLLASLLSAIPLLSFVKSDQSLFQVRNFIE